MVEVYLCQGIQTPRRLSLGDYQTVDNKVISVRADGIYLNNQLEVDYTFTHKFTLILSSDVSILIINAKQSKGS